MTQKRVPASAMGKPGKIKAKLLAVMFACGAVPSGNSLAVVMIDVFDRGDRAEFSFSGSDTVSTGGSLNNGFWLSELDEVMACSGDPNFFEEHRILSGSADLLLNGVAYGVDDVWVNGDRRDFELGFRNDSPPLHPPLVFVGDTIGLTGSIVTDLNYSWFNEGSFDLSSTDPFAPKVVLSEGISFNAGSAFVSTNTVAEPSSLALYGLGLMVLGSSIRTGRRS